MTATFKAFLQTYPGFANVEILLNGVFLSSEDKDTRGATFLYVKKNQGIPSSPGQDDSNFDNFWDQPRTFWEQSRSEVPTLRIVILVNLASITSVTQMYVTLLHEWIAHGRHWQGVIDAFRQNNMQAVAAVRVNDTPVDSNSSASPDNQRERQEHSAYSELSDDELRTWVHSALPENGNMRTRVLNALKKDRNDERQGNGDGE